MTEELREALLKSTLRHVPFDGWSLRALRAGAEAIGLSQASIKVYFPGGGTEVLELHSRILDKRMEKTLIMSELNDMRIRDRIALAIRLRLETMEGEREAVRRAVTLLALPQNASLSWCLLYRTVDAMWRAVGDTAADWNFYSKRGLLAVVYGSSLLFWLQDETENKEETWKFISRRIDDVMLFPQIHAKIRRFLFKASQRISVRAPRV